MKSMGDTMLLKSGIVSPMECLHYALSRPVSVVITGIDKPELLDQAFEAANTYQNVTQQQLDALLARTASQAKQGKWELFKTSTRFDSTSMHPEWLGGDSPHVQAVAPM
jgi:hypothetical protein